MSLRSTDRSEGDLGVVAIVNIVDLDSVKGRDGDDLRAIPVTVIVEDGTTGLWRCVCVCVCVTLASCTIHIGFYFTEETLMSCSPPKLGESRATAYSLV